MANNNSGKIGVATATITGMNAMIGSGIFTAPAILASNIGPAGILAYIFVVASVWFMAQSIARVASLFPDEGSFYTYAKQWGGHAIGMISASSYIIGLTIAVGVLTTIAGHHLVPFFPKTNPSTLGLIALLILIVLNIFGAVLSQIGQKILICCTVFPLLAIIGMCFSKADFSLLTPFAPHGFGSVLKATRLVVFSFFGFESASALFNLVKNPKKNVPRALTYSITFVGILYILFVSAIIVSVPLELFSNAHTPLAETLKIIFPGLPWFITIIHVSILSAILGTMHSLIWGSSNLLFSLTKKMKNKTIQSAIKSDLLTPKVAVLVIGAFVLLGFLTITNLDLFFFLTATFMVFAYITAMITPLTIKKEWKSGRNIISVLGIATATLILVFALQGVWEQLTKLTY
ncbi:amino acid permease [bacterium]|nr:amino acid permease [bacterium]